MVETTYGQGRAYYIGTRLDADGLAQVYARVGALSREDQRVASTPGVERVVRASASHTYEFLINHSADERHVVVAPGGFELLSGRDLDAKVTLPSMGVAIVRRPGSLSLG